MAMPAPNERVSHLPVDREPVAAKIARLEEGQKAIAADVSEVKATVKQLAKHLDHRVGYLEDVRVRGIEEREIRRNAIADERARASDAARDAAGQRTTVKFSRWQVVLAAVMAIGTIALVAVAAVQAFS